MSDPKGTIIVTGAAGGLGKAVANEFTKQDYHLQAIFTVRDCDHKNAKRLQGILQNDQRCQIQSLELESLENVRKFAAGINTRVASAQLAPITALCLNAGYMSSHGQSFTKDGYEKNFQINYLANFLLALLLLPSMDRKRGRIVFVTSFSHDPNSKHAKGLPLPKELFQPADFLAHPRPDKENRHRAGFRRYAESKMCAMMLMHALQARLDEDESLSSIVVLAVDPGVVAKTSIMREQHITNRLVVEKVFAAITPLAQRLSPDGLLRTKKRSAQDILNACTGAKGPAAGHNSKGMVVNGSGLQFSSEESRDVGKQDLLWKGSLKLAGLAGEMHQLRGLHCDDYDSSSDTLADPIFVS